MSNQRDRRITGLFASLRQDVDKIAAEVRLLRDVLESLPEVAVFVVDADLIIQACGGEMLVRSGFEPSVNGRYLPDVIPEGPDNPTVAAYRAALAGSSGHLDRPWDDKTLRIHYAPIRKRHSKMDGAVTLTLEVVK